MPKFSQLSVAVIVLLSAHNKSPFPIISTLSKIYFSARSM